MSESLHELLRELERLSPPVSVGRTDRDWAIMIAAPLAIAVTGGDSSTEQLPVRGFDARSGAAKTVLTLEASSCEGCRVQLAQGQWDDQAPGGATVWQSDEKLVRSGRVSFTIPTSRTRGMSIALDAPWEGQVAGTSTVVMGYEGHTNDGNVSINEARSSRTGSAC